MVRQVRDRDRARTGLDVLVKGEFQVDARIHVLFAVVGRIRHNTWGRGIGLRLESPEGLVRDARVAVPDGVIEGRRRNQYGIGAILAQVDAGVDGGQVVPQIVAMAERNTAHRHGARIGA